jgi:hypothetical protein
MMKFKIISLVCLIFLLQACNNSSSSYESEISQAEAPPEQEIDKYTDGTYCARVDYQNPRTGTHGIYQLNVDVENHEVVKIHFPNGGWLDEDHFIAEQLDENGTCSFTSDKNCNYTIEILGDECNFEQTQSYLNIQQCAQLNGISDAELKQYLNLRNILITDSVRMEECEIIVKYIKEVRGINQSMNSLNNEMNEGYIQKVLFSNLPMGICHQIIVKKHGKYYWLEVNSTEKCSMGTMKFNSSQSGWQNVSVKESPDDNNPNGYQMRIKDSGSSLSELDAEIMAYCNL